MSVGSSTSLLLVHATILLLAIYGRASPLASSASQELDDDLDEDPEPAYSTTPSSWYDDDADNEADTEPNPNAKLPRGAYVSCAHLRRLAHLDVSLHEASQALNLCRSRGLGAEEIEAGAVRRGIHGEDEETEQSGSYEDLYISCADAFSVNLGKLTSSLLVDYLECRENGALNDTLRAFYEMRYGDIIEAWTKGNASSSPDARATAPLASCGVPGASRRLVMECRDYGLTERQAAQGFLPHQHPDRWVVEEELAQLGLGCDRVFAAGLEMEAYGAEAERAFVGCRGAMSWCPRIRDKYEKENGARIARWKKALNTTGASVDLRSYVSCRHLPLVRIKNSLINPSLQARDRCAASGLTYDELRGVPVSTSMGDDRGLGPRPRPSRDVDDADDVDEMYVSCAEVFNEELGSFTTDLTKDYNFCAEVGALDNETRRSIEERFGVLFEILSKDAELSAKPKKPTTTTTAIDDDLVSCSGFTGKLEELCRRRGFTLAQASAGYGGLARSLDGLWLNADPLDELYVRCDDLFSSPHARGLESVPVAQYMQCLWTEDLGEPAERWIADRVGRVYVDREASGNGTTTVGQQSDIDIAIASSILAHR